MFRRLADKLAYERKCVPVHWYIECFEHNYDIMPKKLYFRINGSMCELQDYLVCVQFRLCLT